MKSQAFFGKRLVLSLSIAASVVLSSGLPVSAQKQNANKPAAQIWRVIWKLRESAQALRTFGQPDPYRWFRLPSAERTPLSLFDEREDEIIAQMMPLYLSQMFGTPNISADDPSLTHPTPWAGHEGITETVAQIMARGNDSPFPIRPARTKRQYPPR